MEEGNAIQAILVGLLGAGGGVAIIQLIRLVVSSWADKGKRSDEEDTSWRGEFFKRLERAENRIKVLENRLEKRDIEYDDLQQRYYGLLVESTKDKEKLQQMRAEIERLTERISNLEQELDELEKR